MAGSSLSWLTLRDRLISIDEAHSIKPPDALTAAALLYIALPNFIFLGGWLKLPYAVIAVALLFISLTQFLRNSQLRWQQPYTPGALLIIVSSAFAWSSLGGAGHFFHANPDWMIRDTVLADLALTPWPPAYSHIDGTYHILRSAFGFFFPASTFAKWQGIGHVDIVLYSWVGLGVTLFLLLLPLPRQASMLLLLTLLIALLFSGMDFLGILLLTGDTPIFPLCLEWWAPFTYSSLTGQLHWAPNHALPLWLVAALFYRHWGHHSFPAMVVVLLPLLMIWTPFAAAGILPFIAVATVRWFSQGRSIRDWNLTPIQCLTAGVLAYISIRLLTLDISAIPGAPTAEVAPSKDRFLLKYLLFVLMEFAILGLMLARNLKHSKGLLVLACIILAALPLYQYGPSNDTMLRLSTPSLVILLILTLDQINTYKIARSAWEIPANTWGIGLVLLIGAHTPINEMWRALTFRYTPANYRVSLVEQHKGFEAPHYVGRFDRPDLKLLFREPSLVPTGSQRQLLLDEAIAGTHAH